MDREQQTFFHHFSCLININLTVRKTSISQQKDIVRGRFPFDTLNVYHTHKPFANKSLYLNGMHLLNKTLNKYLRTKLRILLHWTGNLLFNPFLWREKDSFMIVSTRFRSAYFSNDGFCWCTDSYTDSTFSNSSKERSHNAILDRLPARIFRW